MFCTCLLKKTVVSGKGGTLVFAHHYSVLARFWGSGTSWGLKKTRKNSTWEIMFFWLEKKGPKNCFFMILGSFRGPFWSSGATQNHRINFPVFFGVWCPSLDHFGTTFGSILGSFGVTFEVVLAVCSVLFPSRGLKWGSIGIFYPNRFLRTIFETCSRFFQLFFHLLAWSRPRRRRGRRPLQ